MIKDCKDRAEIRERWYQQEFALANNLRLSHNGLPDPQKSLNAEKLKKGTYVLD